MANIFTDTDTLRLFVPVNKDTKFTEIEPFINDALETFIRPIIGDALVTLLNSLSANSTDPLLKAVREPLASYAFLLWIPFGQLSIDTSGIRINTTDTKKTAFQWQIEDLKKTFKLKGDNGIESLLRFLETDEGTTQTYTPSWGAQSSLVRDSFVYSATEFTNIVGLINNSRRTFLALKPVMKLVEDFTIKPMLGNVLYAVYKAGVANASGALNATLLDLIKKATAHATVSKGVTELSCEMSEAGFLVFNNTGQSGTILNKENSPNNFISKIETLHQQHAEAFLSQIRDYLNENISSFPDYANSSAYNDGTQKTFTNSTDNNFFFAG
jgi:hypothetical protein